MQATKTHWARKEKFSFFSRLAVALLAFALVFPSSALAAGEGGEGVAGNGVRYLAPIGRTVGIKLFSEGVLVIGLSDIKTEEGNSSPAKTCGLREGDIITHINGEEVNTIEEVQKLLQELGGEELQVGVLRNQTKTEVTAQAAQSTADGSYKLGAWIRDSMAGIGTMTFYDPVSRVFGTLGHGINDVDTAVLIPLESGSIMHATVADVKRGLSGQPGELHGRFKVDQDLGELYANTEGGVFGHLSDASLAEGIPLLPVAEAAQVKVGKATILCNISGDEVCEYEVKITKVLNNVQDTRDLTLEVKDQRLLDKTGGIVQGMSGSPILQDGKLVGAVTHVMVNDPTRGYGILATRMLDLAEAAS